MPERRGTIRTRSRSGTSAALQVYVRARSRPNWRDARREQPSRSGGSRAACAFLDVPADAWVPIGPREFRAVAYEFKLPRPRRGLTEGEVARWLVSEGDEVAEDQPLVEIQTDKTTVEIPSPAAGTVARILVEEGRSSRSAPCSS